MVITSCPGFYSQQLLLSCSSLFLMIIVTCGLIITLIISTYTFSSFRSLAQYLSALIGHSQKLIRQYAAEHLHLAYEFTIDISKKLSHSCVSQRDIQVRVQVL